VDVAPALYAFNSVGQIQLPNGNVSALVVTNSTNSTTYANGTDYTLDAVNGIVARIATGAILAGASVEIAYKYAEVVAATANGGSAPMAPTN
jgi:hypothetical protein